VIKAIAFLFKLILPFIYIIVAYMYSQSKCMYIFECINGILFFIFTVALFMTFYIIIFDD